MSHIPELEPHCGSWVVIEKANGRVIGEFFNRRSVEAFDPEKVTVMTTAQYLGSLTK